MQYLIGTVARFCCHTVTSGGQRGNLPESLIVVSTVKLKSDATIQDKNKPAGVYTPRVKQYAVDVFRFLTRFLFNGLIKISKAVNVPECFIKQPFKMNKNFT